jgi:hypothetical protein
MDLAIKPSQRAMAARPPAGSRYFAHLKAPPAGPHAEPAAVAPDVAKLDMTRRVCF